MNARSSHIDVLRTALGAHEDSARFNAAHGFLRSQLIARRDTAIGRDYLFAADAPGVGAALKDIIEIEHEHGKDLHFDCAKVGGYFLFRIVGRASQRPDIDAYFD
jgi:hypothetical protein